MASNDDLAFNTTRCNRLLRPLQTKLAKLRKELERPRSSQEDRRSSATAFALKASSRKTNVTQPARKPRGLEKRKDPDWMPDTGLGASKKTYGGRGAKKPLSRTSSNSGVDARPGAIAFTPLVARTGGRFQDSPQLHDSPLRRRNNYKGPLLAKANVHDLKTQMPAEIGKLVKGLSESYANLLQATTTGDEKRWNGTRSLFGACLRKLPQYIALEEHFVELDKEDESGDEDTDVSHEVYSYLEQMYETIPGQGWRGFKQVVRSHGTQLLCDALGDQILGSETLHLLVVHCLNASAWDEAEKFLVSFLPCLKPLPMPNTLYANLFDEQRSLYMWMVKDFVARTGRYRFLYDHLEYMISQELLPLEWLATECMRSVWDRLVRSLSDGDQRSYASAFRFLETAIFAGIGLPDESLFEAGEIDTFVRQYKPSSRQEFRDALDTTYSSLLTVFCSIVLINQYREEPVGQATVKRVVWALDSIVIDLLKRKDIQDDLALLGPLEDHLQLFAQRAVWAVFASFLVHLEGCQQDSKLMSLDVCTAGSAIAWIISQYSSKHIEYSELLSTLPAFVSAAARGTGRIWKDDGFEQIQRLVQGMLSVSGLRLPHKLWTMKRLALESVMDFAQNTNEAQHMAYARDVEQSMRMKGHVVIAPTPHKNDSPSAVGGFRWEEGIGEWVTCTPFTKESIKRVSRKPVPALQLLPSPDPSDLDDTDDGTAAGPASTPSNKLSMWEALADDEDAEDHILQSSPIKTTTRRSTFVGKRTRASLPKVVIPVKRTTMTPPDTPVLFFSEEDLEALNDGPRRSKRAKRQGYLSASTNRPQRLRSSLDEGLRNLKRRAYGESKNIDKDLVESSESEEESDPNRSVSNSRSSGVSRQPELRAVRSMPSLGKRKREFPGKDNDGVEKQPSKMPTLNRRRSRRRTVKGVKEWWKVDDGVVSTEGSDDELAH
ncbi:uncharacterized protein CC84DRAFT_1120372 [Paraphaeosphaeria sporulosa]|uniref:Uncharacterized protein n=1 Tax=Paraphaeosphaeria sporulosa TaxID=1460663 RepID=A0A177CHS9_9PLEO|nr:uncharacterized protein CC84DRAFT_1120372 [Paraphaeosphaeria sporulosa]OAG06428.1 hypothetical protein CC84DRAFT_1120372 [Paraphaeosphaeria sporulosa]